MSTRLSAARPDLPPGTLARHRFFKFHRHDHVEEHCRQALASTKVVHVEAPSLDRAG